MLFNTAAYDVVGAVICPSPEYCCGAPLLSFGAFAGLAVLSAWPGSPMIKYELLEANPDLVGVSVCDSRRWLSSDARIYFADGTLQYNGQLAKAFQVNVEHCNFE